MNALLPEQRVSCPKCGGFNCMTFQMAAIQTHLPLVESPQKPGLPVAHIITAGCLTYLGFGFLMFLVSAIWRINGDPLHVLTLIVSGLAAWYWTSLERKKLRPKLDEHRVFLDTWRYSWVCLQCNNRWIFRP